MRILAVTPYFPPEGGGLERYAHETLSRLAVRGHQVRVLTSTRRAPGTEVNGDVTVDRERPAVFVGNSPVDPRQIGRAHV